MANFAKPVQEASDEELYQWVNTLNPHYVSLASDELSRRALGKLNENVKTLADATEINNQKTEIFIVRMYWLTIV